jgi:ATP-binding cassette subfamily B protein/subfamily B ATP-binding cassette protein MsbA
MSMFLGNNGVAERKARWTMGHPRPAEESKVTVHRYRKLLRYPLRQWPILVVIFVLTALTSAVTVLQPWPLKILIDYALGETAVPMLIRTFFEHISLSRTPAVLVIVAAIAMLGLFAINSLLDVGLTWTWATAGQRMVYDLAADFFYKLQRFSLLYYSQHRVGDALSRLAEDTYCVYSLTADLLISPWQRGLTLATIGMVAWNIDPVLTMISMSVAPIMAGSTMYFAPRLKKRARLDREVRSRLTSFVHQTITVIPLVQAFSTEVRNQKQFQDISTDAVSASQRSVLLKSWYGLVNGFITTIGTAVVLFAGGQRVLSGALSIGSLIVFLAYLRSMQEAIRGLLGIYGSLKTTEASIDRVFEVMESQNSVQEMPGAKPLPADRERKGRNVRLERVTFGYETGRPVLEDITMEAKSGETMAIVGPTGAGKSTLMSLILRYFDPWEGRVTLDGIDIRTIKLSSLRAQVAIVLQEPFLLPLTVAENIAYGLPEASRAKVEAAAIAANADEFIRHLPDGYDTIIGERGATLSGGEKQRLAIARALLKNAPVLILDEPTSALDAQTEALLLEALALLIDGRTTLIIAHRLSTIRKANRIVVLEEGKVMETGSHQDLIATNGIYTQLYYLQFSKPAK